MRRLGVEYKVGSIIRSGERPDRIHRTWNGTEFGCIPISISGYTESLIDMLSQQDSQPIWITLLLSGVGAMSSLLMLSDNSIEMADPFLAPPSSLQYAFKLFPVPVLPASR